MVNLHVIGLAIVLYASSQSLVCSCTSMLCGRGDVSSRLFDDSSKCMIHQRVALATGVGVGLIPTSVVDEYNHVISMCVL